MTTRADAAALRRTQILDAITAYREQHGVGPSMDELGVLVGLSRTAVRHHVDNLTAAGKLVRDPNRYRSMRIAS